MPYALMPAGTSRASVALPPTTKICTYHHPLCAHPPHMRRIALASRRAIDEDTPGGPSRRHRVLCSPKRRQSGSEVESNNTPGPPDDPANTTRRRTNHPPAVLECFLVEQPLSLFQREALPSALAYRLCQPRGKRRDTRASAVSPSPPIPVRQPLSRVATATRGDHPTHAETESPLHCTKHPTAATPAETSHCLFFRDPNAQSPVPTPPSTPSPSQSICSAAPACADMHPRPNSPHMPRVACLRWPSP
jgi:hypothetical protein